MGWVMQGCHGSCRGGVGLVMQGWGVSCIVVDAGVGWVMQTQGGSCIVGHVGVEWVIVG